MKGVVFVQYDMQTRGSDEERLYGACCSLHKVCWSSIVRQPVFSYKQTL